MNSDPYVVDMAVTNDHFTCVTSVVWYPLEEDLVGSCGIDGSVQIWDVRRDGDGDGGGGSTGQKIVFGKLCTKTGVGYCI